MSKKYLYKFILVGDAGVGKSCILLQYTNKKFEVSYDYTVGIEFGSQMIEINNTLIQIQIWDTAGQETFRSITRNYYREAAGAILVYDITRRTSFTNVQIWLEDILQHSPKQTEITLIGNKTDLEKNRVVSYEEGKKFAKKNNLHFMECSAKTSYNIDKIFVDFANIIYNKTCSLGTEELVKYQGVKLIPLDPEEQQTTNEKSKNNNQCC
ncbi:ras-related protein rab-2-a [Anaeramoeba flamelloides]|uniref:Ras-related protein rab-2-a n=1 Tax=Anaeramoeba flamelloides TaxID=1746091 RepID=A0AAV7ZXD1_9EUKA|nr:ras-related protein rab-2-a [Anaeramoeba flamelloides]KAJ6249956.1 ras-related protein rab-2-a [Anaeramoeba flamelloides]